ncbi:hypothetical protein BHE74_00032807 [Ensete ventricosum]|nr:hypothetical protein BHE74_00032807 [Ensete ventricosum]
MAPKKNRARRIESRKQPCPCIRAVESPGGGHPAATSRLPGQSAAPRLSSTPPTQKTPSSQETFSVPLREGEQSYEFVNFTASGEVWLDPDQMEKMKLDCSSSLKRVMSQLLSDMPYAVGMIDELQRLVDGDKSEEAMEEIIHLSEGLEVVFYDCSFDMKHLAWKFKRQLGERFLQEKCCSGSKAEKQPTSGSSEGATVSSVDDAMAFDVSAAAAEGRRKKKQDIPAP